MQNKLLTLKVIFISILILFCNASYSTDKTQIRLGILPFGTVNWELSAFKQAYFSSNANFELHIQHVANPQAGKIALQAGAVDMIVSDWIWVSRQRSNGLDLSFYPYSNSAGALLVAADSPIQSLTDLKQTRLGIAGGELDKNWLLLRALMLQKYQLDINQQVEKVFAAPPLLNQQLIQGRVDAIINYWHYAARLESTGYRQIIDGREIQQQIGVKASVPTLGYVFKQSWAEQHQQALTDFFQLMRKSKDLVCNSDASWNKIVTLIKNDQPETQKLLRTRYCSGRVKHWGDAELQSAQQIYQILKELSNNRLTGNSESIQKGTFWMPENLLAKP